MIVGIMMLLNIYVLNELKNSFVMFDFMEFVRNFECLLWNQHQLYEDAYLLIKKWIKWVHIINSQYLIWWSPFFGFLSLSLNKKAKRYYRIFFIFCLHFPILLFLYFLRRFLFSLILLYLTWSNFLGLYLICFVFEIKSAIWPV